MADSIWKSTLEEFRVQLAGRDPVPAGVSVAAVAASLALNLLRKALEITRKRRDFRGDPRMVEELLARAQAASDELARLADEDVAAFAEYMASRGTPNQESANQESALRRAIEVPLRAARVAAEGVELCAQAGAIVPESIAPDLGTAALLLASAIHATLLSAESNALQISDARFRSEVEREAADLMQLAAMHRRW